MKRDILFSMRKLVLLTLLACSALFGADITGAWDFAVETGQGSGNPAFTFKQDGEKLMGKNEFNGNESELHDGKVQGDVISFQIIRERDGRTVTAKYRGHIKQHAHRSYLYERAGSQFDAFRGKSADAQCC